MKDEEIGITPEWVGSSIIPNNGSTKHQFRCTACGDYKNPCFTTIPLDAPDPKDCVQPGKRAFFEEEILCEFIEKEEIKKNRKLVKV